MTESPGGPAAGDRSRGAAVSRDEPLAAGLIPEPTDRGPDLFEAPERGEPAEGVLELREAQPAFVLLAVLLVMSGIAMGISVGVNSPTPAEGVVAVLLVAGVLMVAVAVFRARRRLVRMDGGGVLQTRPGSPFGTWAVAWDAVDQVTLQRSHGPQWFLRFHHGRRIRSLVLAAESWEQVVGAVEHWTGREVRHVSGPLERFEGRGLRGRGGQGNRDA